MDSTRITNSYLSDSVINDLLSNRSKLVNLQTQISSGKSISNISDNVLHGISVVSTNTSLSKVSNYLTNISNAQGELNVTGQALTSLVNLINSAKALTVQASNASSGPQEMQSINAQIQQLLAQAKGIGNTQYGSTYVFGGLQTNTAPFTSPASGEIQYTGSSASGTQRNVEISDGVTVPINVTGDQILGQYYTSDSTTTPPTVTGSGLINTLTTLSNQLGSATPDQTVISQQLDNLSTNLQTVINAQAQLGGVSNRLTLTQTNLQNDQTNLTQIKSSDEDVDMASAISNLQFQQTALQASLQVSAEVIQPSLLNYLK